MALILHKWEGIISQGKNIPTLRTQISVFYNLSFFFFCLSVKTLKPFFNLSLLFHNRRLHREQNFIVALISRPDGRAEYKTLYRSNNDLSLGTTHLTPPAELVGGKHWQIVVTSGSVQVWVHVSVRSWREGGLLKARHAALLNLPWINKGKRNTTPNN